MRWGYLGMVVVNLPLALFAAPVLGFFHLAPATTALAREMFNLHLIFLVIWPTSFSLPNALRAANDARFTMTWSLLSMGLVRIGLSYLLAWTTGLGVMAVWWAMVMDWALRSVAFVIRFEHGKWRAHSELV
jgi:Na+-driven multidrug efflux pump